MAPRYTHVTLRLFLLMSILGALLLQTLVLPAMASSMAERFPEVADLELPTLALAIFVLACFEIALACAWMLAGATRRGEIFSSGSLRWVNLICACLALTALALAGFTLFDLCAGIGPISVPAFFSALLFVDIGCLSIVLVLRALLIGATGLQSELDEVI